ncbi:hypothetical protein KJ616_01465 [Patescibacteria group bacterium]|nr:hypothetical protein [Patescibacteria group bacterium]
MGFRLLLEEGKIELTPFFHHFSIIFPLESILFLDSLVRFYPFIVSGLQTDNHATFTNRYTGYPKSSNPMKPRLHPLDMECEKLGITHYLIDKDKWGQLYFYYLSKGFRNVRVLESRKKWSKWGQLYFYYLSKGFRNVRVLESRKK